MHATFATKSESSDIVQRAQVIRFRCSFKELSFHFVSDTTTRSVPYLPRSQPSVMCCKPLLFIPWPSSLTQQDHSSIAMPTSILFVSASNEFCTSSEIIWGREVMICVERIFERVSLSSFCRALLAMRYSSISTVNITMFERVYAFYERWQL